jgi:hypothetical protein
MATDTGRLDSPRHAAGHTFPRHAAPTRILDGVRRKPDAVTAVPALARRERVLATQADQSGAPIVATTLALYHRGGQTGWARLGWAEAGQVRWDAERSLLDVTRLVPAGHPGITAILRSRTPLLALARERLAATHLASVHVALPDAPNAVVLSRRDPGTGAPVWVVLLPDGVDRSEPEVALAISSAIRHLRVQTGIA